MRWSSANFVPKEKADELVLDFVPRKFDLGTPDAAKAYLEVKKHGSDFKMSDPLRVQTGVDIIEERSQDSLIEERVLERIKEIQEKAYHEAFELGREEGKLEAFNSLYHEMTEGLKGLDELMISIGNLKKELISQNESHMVKLVFLFASRLAQDHLIEKEESIVKVLREAVSLAQGEENIFVRVSDQQAKFIEEVKGFTEREFEFVKRLRIEPDATIKPGGCIVETNYGEVDARIEQRIEQLWNTLKEQMPRVRPKLVAVGVGSSSENGDNSGTGE